MLRRNARTSGLNNRAKCAWSNKPFWMAEINDRNLCPSGTAVSAGLMRFQSTRIGEKGIPVSCARQMPDPFRGQERHDWICPVTPKGCLSSRQCDSMTCAIQVSMSRCSLYSVEGYRFNDQLPIDPHVFDGGGLSILPSVLLLDPHPLKWHRWPGTDLPSSISFSIQPIQLSASIK